MSRTRAMIATIAITLAGGITPIAAAQDSWVVELIGQAGRVDQQRGPYSTYQAAYRAELEWIEERKNNPNDLRLTRIRKLSGGGLRSPVDQVMARATGQVDELMRQTERVARLGGVTNGPDVGLVLGEYRQNVENAYQSAKELKKGLVEFQNDGTKSLFDNIDRLLEAQAQVQADLSFANAYQTVLKEESQLLETMSKEQAEEITDVLKAVTTTKDPQERERLLKELAAFQKSGKLRDAIVARADLQQAARRTQKWARESARLKKLASRQKRQSQQIAARIRRAATTPPPTISDKKPANRTYRALTDFPTPTPQEKAFVGTWNVYETQDLLLQPGGVAYWILYAKDGRLKEVKKISWRVVGTVGIKPHPDMQGSWRDRTWTTTGIRFDGDKRIWGMWTDKNSKGRLVPSGFYDGRDWYDQSGEDFRTPSEAFGESPRDDGTVAGTRWAGTSFWSSNPKTKYLVSLQFRADGTAWKRSRMKVEEVKWSQSGDKITLNDPAGRRETFTVSGARMTGRYRAPNGNVRTYELSNSSGE